MTVQVLRRAVPDIGRPMPDRLEQTGRREGVVDDQRHRAEGPRQLRQIGHFDERIRHALRDAEFRLGRDRGADGVQIGDVDE